MVAAVVLLVALLPLARHLLDRRIELLATNTRSAFSPSAETVRPGERSCTDLRRDDLLTIPSGTTAVRLFPAYTSRAAPRLSVVLTGAGATVRGDSPATYPPGQPVLLALDRTVPDGVRRICVRNDGRSTVTLARAVDAGGNDREVPLDQGGPDREPRVRSTVRFDLIGEQDAVALSLLGEGLDHAGAYKPDGVGPVVIAAGFVLLLLGGLTGVVFVLRTPDDEDVSDGFAAATDPTGPPADDATDQGPPGSGAPVAPHRDDRGGW